MGWRTGGLDAAVGDDGDGDGLAELVGDEGAEGVWRCNSVGGRCF